MTEGFDSALLAELDRIVSRFGPSSVAGLAELIRDPQRAEELAAALESAAARPARIRASPKSRKPDRIGMGVVKDLRLSDPEKHAIVAEIRRHLLSGTVLQSMAELRRFARKHGLSIGKASSRNAAIVPLLRSISELSTPEIVSLRDAIIHFNVNDRSLERWRDVIVRSRLSQGPGKEGLD